MADTMCTCQPQRNPYAVDRTLTKEQISKPSGQAPSEQVVQEDCLGAKAVLAFARQLKGHSRAAHDHRRQSYRRLTERVNTKLRLNMKLYVSIPTGYMMAVSNDRG